MIAVKLLVQYNDVVIMAYKRNNESDNKLNIIQLILFILACIIWGLSNFIGMNVDTLFSLGENSWIFMFLFIYGGIIIAAIILLIALVIGVFCLIGYKERRQEQNIACILLMILTLLVLVLIWFPFL